MKSMIGAVLAMAALLGLPADAKDAQQKSPRLVAKGYQATAVVKGTRLRGSNGMNFDDEGRLLVGHLLSSHVSRINVDTGEIEILFDHERGVRGPDDLTTDGKGTIWTSNMTGLGGESVFRMDKDGKVSAIYSGILATNGIQYNRRTGRLFVDQAFVGGGIYELDPKGEKPARLVSSEFPLTNSMDFDLDNNLIVVVSGGNPGVRVINPDTGKSSTLGIDIPRFGAVKVGRNGDIFATGGNAVYKVTADRKQVITLFKGEAYFDNLAVSPEGRVFAASMIDATIYEIATDGSGTIKQMLSPKGLPNISSLAALGNDVYLADTHVLRKINLQTGELTSMVGLSTGKGSGDTGFLVGYVHEGPGGLLYAINSIGFPVASLNALPVYTVDPNTLDIRKITRNPFQGLHLPTAIYANHSDAFIYATEFIDGKIEAIPVNDDQIKRKTVATNLSGPNGIVKKGDKLYVAESLGQRISVIDLTNGRQDVLLSGGVGRPSAIDMDKDGNLLVLDSEGRRLLKINPDNAAMSVIADNLPIYPNIFANWPVVQVPNGLAVTADGAIYVGGNTDGSVWKFTSAKAR